MQIVKEGDKWLAPQRVTAKWFGVSVQAFQRWGYEPIRTEGRVKLYDVRAIWVDRQQVGITEEDLDLTKERARLAKEQADKQEMENQVRRGELVEADEILSVVGDHIHAAKTKLLALPSQISTYLQQKDAADINGQLTDAIHDALAELSDGTAELLETAETPDDQ